MIQSSALFRRPDSRSIGCLERWRTVSRRSRANFFACLFGIFLNEGFCFMLHPLPAHSIGARTPSRCAMGYSLFVRAWALTFSTIGRSTSRSVGAPTSWPSSQSSVLITQSLYKCVFLPQASRANCGIPGRRAARVASPSFFDRAFGSRADAARMMLGHASMHAAAHGVACKK